MKKVKLSVEGMSCAHCKSSVEKMLRGAAGVKQADVDLQQNTAEVTFDEHLTSEENLKKVINESGMFSAS
jgi:copper chaperone